MGGNVLDLEVIRIHKDGYNKGYNDGFKDAKKEALKELFKEGLISKEVYEDSLNKLDSK